MLKAQKQDSSFLLANPNHSSTHDDGTPSSSSSFVGAAATGGIDEKDGGGLNQMLYTYHRLASSVTETVYRRIDTQRRLSLDDDQEVDKADTFRSLAIPTLENGDLTSSLSHLANALQLYRSCSDRINEADTLQLRAGLKMEIEIIDEECSADLEKALAIYREQSDLSGEAWCLKLGAELKLMEVITRRGAQRGHDAAQEQNLALADAHSQVQKAYAMFSAMNDQNGIASALRVRGRLNLQLGNSLGFFFFFLIITLCCVYG